MCKNKYFACGNFFLICGIFGLLVLGIVLPFVLEKVLADGLNRQTLLTQDAQSKNTEAWFIKSKSLFGRELSGSGLLIAKMEHLQ